MRGNIGGDLSFPIVISTSARDMAAFDQLPAEVRALLRDAPFSLSSEALLPFLREWNGPALARAVLSTLMREFPRWTPPA